MNTDRRYIYPLMTQFSCQLICIQLVPLQCSFVFLAIGMPLFELHLNTDCCQYTQPKIIHAWGSYSAYKYGYQYRNEVVSYIRQIQTKLVAVINRMPFPVKAALLEATYLLWVDFRGTGWIQDEIQRFLVEDAGLGFNRGDSFGANGTGFVRINCAAPESRIDEAIQRLTNAFASRCGE